MSWIFVDESGRECASDSKPKYLKRTNHYRVQNEINVYLKPGTIEKIIDRKMVCGEEPIHTECIYIYFNPNKETYNHKVKLNKKNHMKSLKDIEICKLETNDIIYLFDKDEVTRYKFLSFHPNNDNYMILLDMCEQPVRFYIDSDYVQNNFFIDCTRKDILEYRKEYYKKKLKEVETELNNII